MLREATIFDAELGAALLEGAREAVGDTPPRKTRRGTREATALSADFGTTLLIELRRHSAAGCSFRRFDSDGVSRQRTRTFTSTAAVLVKAQVGDGKSHTAMVEVRGVLEDRPSTRIAFVVDKAKLQAQAKARLEEVTGWLWGTYVGFERERGGVPLCAFVDEAKAARKMGLDPYEHLCPGCPNQDHCQLWAQYTARDNLWVVTHAQVRHGMKPLNEREHFDIVIIDEDPMATLLGEETYALSLLRDVSRSEKHRATLDHVLRAADNASVDGRINILDLPDPEALLSAADSLGKKANTKFSRDAPPDDDVVAKAETRLQTAALLRDLIDAMAMKTGSNGEVGGCTVREQKGGKRVIKIAVPRDIHPQFANADVVKVLSATAEPLLLHRSIPKLMLHETRWKPHKHGTFVYLRGAKVSINSLLTDGKKKLAPGGLEALEVVRTLARRYQRVLVVAQKDVETALVKVGLPDNVATGHFNALEGLNDHENVDAILILGRPLPPDPELILQAEAAAGGSIDAELSWTNDDAGTGGPTFGKKVELELTAKDGSTYIADDYRHENPYVEAMRRAVTFAAVAQADRSRGQRRGPDNPVVIYDATGLANVWEIDRVEHWLSLCDWHSEQAGYGFVPHPKARRCLNQQLAIYQPHRFADAKAAENYRGHAKRTRGETLETQVNAIPFRDGVVVYITMPGDPCGVPWIVNANTATEAATLIRQHPNTPPGTEISTKARHTMRLDQQSKTESSNGAIEYELAAGSRELADSAEAAEAEDAAGECEEELVCEDGATAPACPSAGH